MGDELQTGSLTTHALSALDGAGSVVPAILTSLRKGGATHAAVAERYGVPRSVVDRVCIVGTMDREGGLNCPHKG